MKMRNISPGNLCKGRQQFVKSIVLSALLIVQKGIGTGKMSLRHNLNPAIERRMILGFAKVTIQSRKQNIRKGNDF